MSDNKLVCNSLSIANILNRSTLLTKSTLNSIKRTSGIDPFTIFKVSSNFQTLSFLGGNISGALESLVHMMYILNLIY
jgi:hypothetical protein